MKSLLTSFLSIIVFTLASVTVHASPTEDLSSRSDVSITKDWNVEFSTKIDASTLDSNIYVKGSNGDKLPLEVTLSDDGTNATVKAPSSGYEADHTYTLYVDNGVKSASGESLRQAVKMSFTTSNQVEKQELKAHFIDVGQGDSILLEMPNGNTMLIDGGRKSAGEKVVSYLKQAGISTIDQLVATHPDADHIGGLIDVLNQFKVNNVLTSGLQHDTDTYKEFHSLIDTKGINKSVAEEGNLIELDSDVTIKVLNSGKNEKDNNEGSVALKVSYNEIDFLLTGDAGEDSELDMVNDFNTEAEIYKVGHHGSDTSSSQELIDETDPEAAILSYGEDNRYDHPNDVVLNRLQTIGAKLYSTSQVGDIIVTTNGSEYSVKAQEFNPIVDEEGTEENNDSNTASDITIKEVSLEDEFVTITNNGDSAVDLSGWHLLSVEGSQSFYFPEGHSLESGETVYVTSGRDAKDQSPTYIKWTGAYIWNNDGDSAKLFDTNGDLEAEWK